MIEIKKARKSDLNVYLILKKNEEKDYSKIIGKKIKYPKDAILKREFNEALKSKKRLILLAEDKKRILGYLHGTYFFNSYDNGGYVEDIFVLSSERGKGIGKKLIQEFIRVLKRKKYKNFK